MKMVEQFLHDELLETLPSTYDRSVLSSASTATYVIHQDVCYDYTEPVTDLHQRLVILPRWRHGDQRRIGHRFDVRSCDGATVRCRTDRFGNPVLHIAVAIVPEGIDFQARAVVTRHPNRLPAHDDWDARRPTITPLTDPDEAIRDAAVPFAGIGEVEETADRIGEFVRDAFSYGHDVTTVRTTAAEAWRGRTGVCQDMAHVMIAICTSIGIPSRYVSGHLVGDGASLAWVEVYDERRRAVIAVDPTHSRRTDLRYITTAVGRDYRDVAPTAGTYVSGGGTGRLTVRKKIRLADVT